MTNENLPAHIELIGPDNTVTQKVFVTIDGQDWQRDLSALGLSFDSSEQEIMDIIVPLIEEEFGTDIRDLYKIRKATNNQNVFIIPNSVAGEMHTTCRICKETAFNGFVCFYCGFYTV